MSYCALHAGNKAQSIAAYYEAMPRWKAIVQASANASARNNDDDMYLFTIDFFRRDDGEIRKRTFADQRNCCRCFKDRCGSYLSIRVNAAPFLLVLSRPFSSLLRACNWIGSLVNASRQNRRNHANDKIFSPCGNFTSSTMAHDGGARQFQSVYWV